MEKIQYTTLSETKNSSFNYMGCTYCYPVIRQQKYAIKGFSMTSGQNMLCRYTGNDHTLFADVTRPVELKLSFTPEQCKAKNFHLNMTHFLYREGNPVPLSTAIILTNEEAVTTQTFRLPDGEARTGTYFIFFPKAQRQGRNGSLVDIPEGLVYRFSLIAQNVNGSTIGVRYAECHIFNQKVYPHAVHSGNMICRLSLDELPEEPYTLGMYCYNPTFTLMGKEERKFKAIKAQRRQVTFEMSTNRIWHPGVYKLVLTQNRIPISVIDICLQDNNYMTSTVRPMDPDSLLYWMVKELETTDYMVHSWEKIRDHPGIGESRMQFVRMHREWKQKSDNCIRRGAEVLVVSGYTSAAANEAAMGFSDLLMTGKKLKHYFYCDQPIDFLLQSYDSDDYHGDLQIFYSASRLLQPEWEPFMEMLVRRIKQVDDTTLYVFCDTPEGIGRLFSRYPQIRAQSAPERVIAVRKPNTREMTDKLLECFHRCGAIPKIDLFDTMESFLYEYMADSDIQEELIHWNESEMEAYARMVRDNAIADQGLAKDVVTPVSISWTDIIPMCDYFIGHPTEYARKKCSATKEHQEFQQAMKDLNAMVGLQSIKNGLNRTMSQVRFNQLRKLEGLPVDFEAPHHMIFVGNPGTGKTTVARMIGQIYKSLGLLSDGEVISADRSSLVGEYIGETERKMRGLIEEARGKVLFIDEAYSLCDSLSDRRDYGSRVIETLLPVLAEPDPDMVVILAGYEEEMERLMQHNQGLESRFAYKYHFEDYTAKELFEIAQKELDKQYYQLTEQAGETLLSVCEDRVKNKTRTFANARWIKQVIYNGILPALSKRVMESEGPHDFGKLVTIEVEDVNAAAGMFGKKTNRRRIGF